MPWMVPLHKLDPDQTAFLDTLRREQSNQWIRGFVGSGKSVLLVHALSEACQALPDASVCVVVFTHSLVDMIGTGIPEQFRHRVIVQTYHEFVKSDVHYDRVFVDEVQDLPADVLARLVRQSGRLIVAGDEAQSIYDDRVPPEQIPGILSCKQYQLTILHRLCQRVIAVVQQILPEKRLDRAKRGRLVNVDIELAKAGSESEEARWVWERARQLAGAGNPSAILLPRHDIILEFVATLLRELDLPQWNRCLNAFRKPDYDSLNEHLKAVGLPLQYLGNTYGALSESDHQPVVYVMTYHSAKGLDFDSVFLPGLRHDLVFWRSDDEKARTLLFVALTRSRQNLFLSFTEAPHHLIAAIPDGLVRRTKAVLKSAPHGQPTSAEEVLF